MLDYYREAEQRGCRVTVAADHIRTEYPCGWVKEEYQDGSIREHGTRVFVVSVQVARDTRPRSHAWWRKLFGHRAVQ